MNDAQQIDQVLLRAIDAGDCGGVKDALAKGADPAFLGQLPLWRAAGHGYAAIAHCLLDAGADAQRALSAFNSAGIHSLTRWLQQVHSNWLAHQVAQETSAAVVAESRADAGGLGL